MIHISKALLCRSTDKYCIACGMHTWFWEGLAHRVGCRESCILWNRSPDAFVILSNQLACYMPLLLCLRPLESVDHRLILLVAHYRNIRRWSQGLIDRISRYCAQLTLHLASEYATSAAHHVVWICLGLGATVREWHHGEGLGRLRKRAFLTDWRSAKSWAFREEVVSGHKGLSRLRKCLNIWILLCWTQLVLQFM